ncbi:Ferrous iron transport periplasmic protein EfeO [Pseudonocardia sp. Ae168_Ps1]|uniref:iron uptake system protein EfeO n=1 Tax=unclassified Pseudonocardia TaxID=2619320 RepID=UPI0001FFDD0C|nr:MULTISPECIES: iron uptake system protein EfeO [unclassified Pseudonocardia]ALL74367.1 peptidase M75 [Pseudonocardia sp. EC080610-09]ALL81389.1 peptidase M75 [Pseudonocardia sp. EC080619-01]OLL75657.1 Ferrous iron transport periplasmic protein EfeO [Pseudonocardia sp. Ae150A_Ps1]OLL81656.1 Ferrous iron transport periplasmic protein EfeO [Pseudonocardia sp. Ae168_Ps1]OLL84231.1 Ferrous iron transport periplasmic protein EfeO [Pseudonocardia sp. Ae263_Ps1]
MSPQMRTATGLASLAAVAVLAGCTSTAPTAAGEGGPIEVNNTDTACEVATAEAPAGNITFRVTNAGSKVTEFYLYGTGDRIMGEVENIGPGLSRDLIVEVPDGGSYTTACKPGMSGDGIRAPFTVTGSVARSTDSDARLAEATAGYSRYVASQVGALVPKTQEFADAVKAGDVEKAKALYPVARTYWERIEPVAESFGDIDPRIDGREDDERDPGVGFTGYHRLEKDLWVTGLQPDSPAVADQLTADVGDLATRTTTVVLTPVQLANGAKELLDEVATGKITGEEDRYSHTDLWDFQANVEGSQAAVAALRPVIDAKDPALGPVLDERFQAVDTLLQGYRSGDGYVLYTALTPEDIKKMSAAVDALSEPVSKVAGTVTT